MCSTKTSSSFVFLALAILALTFTVLAVAPAALAKDPPLCPFVCLPAGSAPLSTVCLCTFNNVTNCGTFLLQGGCFLGLQDPSPKAEDQAAILPSRHDLARSGSSVATEASGSCDGSRSGLLPAYLQERFATNEVAESVAVAPVAPAKGQSFVEAP